MRDELRLAFEKFYKSLAKEYNFSIAPSDFDSAIKELDNNFTSISMDDDGKLIVSFHNPSIKDFLIVLINSNPSIQEILIDNLIYYNQAFYAFKKPNEKDNYWIDKYKVNLDSDLEKKLALKSIELTNDMKVTSTKTTYTHNNKKVMKPNIPNISKQLWMLDERFILNLEVQNFIIATLVDINLKEAFITSGQDRPSLITLIDKYNIEAKEKIIYEFLDYLKEDNISNSEDIQCLCYCKDNIHGFNDYYKENEEYFIESIESYVDSVEEEIDIYYDGEDIINAIDEFNQLFGYDIQYANLHEKAYQMGHYEDGYDLWKETSMEQKIDKEIEDRYIDSIFETLTSDQ